MVRFVSWTYLGVLEATVHAAGEVAKVRERSGKGDCLCAWHLEQINGWRRCRFGFGAIAWSGKLVCWNL
jgi:hypothetical protein